MMDDYLNHLISSSAWVDGDTKEQSSWGCCEPSQPNVLLPDSLELYQDDKRNSPVSIISSNHSVESLASQDTSSVILCSESNYAVDKGIIAEEALLQRDGQNSNGNPSPNEAVTGKLKFGNMGLQCDATLPDPTSLNYPKQLPEVDDFASCLSFIQASNSRSYGSEQSEYHMSFKNLQNLPSIPQLWHSPSYESGSSHPPLRGRDRMEGFGLQGGNLDDDMDILGKRYVGMDKILQLNKLSTSAVTEGQEDLQSCPLSSFTSEPNITVAINPSSSPLPQTTSPAPEGGCNGTGKPRIRARRGQATDPHSIAERLRREKIAERMKNLQELVPNSNKVDKASMLDEIIDYVKFLQLQVKVLSMSRLGAAEAVIPLLTDGQAEGSKNLSLAASAGLGIDISSSPDQIAFEQEVLKLMETNVTMAMQYLQSKGLCLMPMALAAAISGGKVSFASTTAEERKKFIHTNGLVHHNSSSSSSSSSCSLPGIETHQTSYDSNIATRAIKQEELKNA